MYQAINRRNNERTEMFWYEEELLDYLEHTSKPSDFWDVYIGGRLEYYFWPPMRMTSEGWKQLRKQLLATEEI